MPDALNNRDGLQAREASKCLSYGELSGRVMEKDWPKRPSDRQLLEAQKKTLNSEKAMATHSSTLAWQILRTEEPGGLPSMGSLGVGHD